MKSTFALRQAVSSGVSGGHVGSVLGMPHMVKSHPGDLPALSLMLF